MQSTQVLHTARPSSKPEVLLKRRRNASEDGHEDQAGPAPKRKRIAQHTPSSPQLTFREDSSAVTWVLTSQIQPRGEVPKSWSDICPERAMSPEQEQTVTGTSKNRSKAYAEFKEFKSTLKQNNVFLSDHTSFLAEAALERLLITDRAYSKPALWADESWKTALEDACENEATLSGLLNSYYIPSTFDIKLSFKLPEPSDTLKRIQDKSWNFQEPLFEAPTPRPDFCIGFTHRAFSKEQHHELACVTGDVDRFSAFPGLYFPFYMIEAKYQQFIEVAECQNAHSTTIAINMVVDLAKAAGQLQKLHLRPIVFSADFNHMKVHIYAHYVVIGSKNEVLSMHRHKIFVFDVEVSKKEDRFVPYVFTANLYMTWAEEHLEFLKSLIDELPE